MARSQSTTMAKNWLLHCTANSKENATIVARLATKQSIVAQRRATITKHKTATETVEDAFATATEVEEDVDSQANATTASFFGHQMVDCQKKKANKGNNAMAAVDRSNNGGHQRRGEKKQRERQRRKQGSAPNGQNGRFDQNK
jgi:hypothetical protein